MQFYTITNGLLKAREITKQYKISFAHYENMDKCLTDHGVPLNRQSLITDDPRENLLNKARALGEVFYPVENVDDETCFRNRPDLGGFMFGMLFPEDSTLAVVAQVGVMETGYIGREFLPAAIVGHALHQLTGSGEGNEPVYEIMKRRAAARAAEKEENN